MQKIKIGLFIDFFIEFYQSNIWYGISSVAKRNNMDLIGFMGSSLNNPYNFYTQNNSIHKLADIKNINGLITLSSSLGVFSNTSNIKKFYSQFSNIPIVNIGVDLKEYPSILIDNKSGIKKLLEHFIKVHNSKKIAFIKGPEYNEESIIRYNTYKQVLKENNIPFDKDLVANGNFHPDSGGLAVYTLLDKRHKQFDTLIAGNDYMALNAIKTLKLKGINVPEDVKVAGFDDFYFYKYTDNPLTTVYQSPFKLGEIACNTLIDLLNNKTVPQKTILPTKLIIRKSCGCNKSEIHENHYIKDTISINTNTNKKIIKKLAILHSIDLSGSLNELLLHLLNSLTGEKDIFTYFLSKTIKQTFYTSKLFIPWHILIKELFNNVYKYYPNLKTNKSDTIFIKSQNLLKQLIKDYKTLKHKTENYISFQLKQLKYEISKAFTIKNLKQILIEKLPSLNIDFFSISLYDRSYKSLKYSIHLVSYENSRNFKNYNKKIKFKSKKIIPDKIKKLINIDEYVIIPLYVKQSNLGFIVLTCDVLKIKLCKIVSVYISNALYAILNSKKYHIKNKSFEKKIKYKNSSLTRSMSNKYYYKLINIMTDEKLYVKPDLNLEYLAKRLSISNVHLSQVINENNNTNFFDFINKFRIDEVKNNLQNPSKKNISLLEIAYDAGFNSKSSFNSVFKKFTNMTPSQFRKYHNVPVAKKSNPIG